MYGRIATAQSEYATAVDDLSQALEIYRELEHRGGTAWTLADLALAEYRFGKLDSRSTLKQAKDQAEGLFHSALDEHLMTIGDEIDAPADATSSDDA